MLRGTYCPKKGVFIPNKKKFNLANLLWSSILQCKIFPSCWI